MEGILFGEVKDSMLKVTCRNHPTAQYLIKNIGYGSTPTRNLHFIRQADGFGFAQECPCPGSDLIFVHNGQQVYH